MGSWESKIRGRRGIIIGGFELVLEGGEAEVIVYVKVFFKREWYICGFESLEW